jgi:hypothetical protein
MDPTRFAEGMRAWSDFQTTHIQTLREKTKGEPTFSEPNIHPKLVLFVEPRRHPSTEFVLRNFRACLPSWPIVVVHGTQNETWMRDIVSRIGGVFSFLNCGMADLPNVSYNTLFTLPEFWRGLGADSVPNQYILTAQTDTALLQNCESQLEKLMTTSYAYVGSPWALHCQVCQRALISNCGHMIDQRVVSSMLPHMVGNGGLSLRRTADLLHIVSQYQMDIVPDQDLLKVWKAAKSQRKTVRGTTNEDVFFCKALWDQSQDLIAPRAVASAFAMEQCMPAEFSSATQPPVLGVHKPWVYLPPPFVKSVLDMASY